MMITKNKGLTIRVMMFFSVLFILSSLAYASLNLSSEAVRCIEGFYNGCSSCIIEVDSTCSTMTVNGNLVVTGTFTGSVCQADDTYLYFDCPTNTKGLMYDSVETQFEFNDTLSVESGHITSTDGYYMKNIGVPTADKRVLWCSPQIVGNLQVGNRVFESLTEGTWNTCVGMDGCTSLTTGYYNTVVGADGAGAALTAGQHNSGFGVFCLRNVREGDYHTSIGEESGVDAAIQDLDTSITIGYKAVAEAVHTGVFASGDANGYIDTLYFNGVTEAAPYDITLTAASGEGTDIAAADITIAGGRPTGTGDPGNVIIQTTDVGAFSGTGSGALVTRGSFTPEGFLSDVAVIDDLEITTQLRSLGYINAGIFGLWDAGLDNRLLINSAEDLSSDAELYISINDTTGSILTIEDDSSLNQDLTTDATVVFGGIAANITTHSATEGITAATMYGNLHRVTGAYTVTLPAAVVGMSAIIRATTAAALVVDCNGSDHFEAYDGTVMGAGVALTSDATKNASITIVCEIANTWIVYGQHGTWS